MESRVTSDDGLAILTLTGRLDYGPGPVEEWPSSQLQGALDSGATRVVIDATEFDMRIDTGSCFGLLTKLAGLAANANAETRVVLSAIQSRRLIETLPGLDLVLALCETVDEAVRELEEHEGKG